MKYVVIMLIVIVSICAYEPYIDFDRSMRLAEYPEKLEADFSRAVYDCAKKLYNHYAPGICAKRTQGTIPRIIHHVWFGIKLSQEDIDLRATWEQYHPTPWQFVLWTDRIENDVRGVVAYTWQEVEDLLAAGHRYIVVDVARLAFDNRIYFDETMYYGERSDILKWEIVYRLGGMYSDFDCICYGSFDALHDQYDFYTGLQPLDTSYIQLGAALFAAEPGHPILKHAVETIAEDRKFVPIIIKTGPIHFSKSFICMAGTSGKRDIAFPASYFYPCSYEQQHLEERCWRKPESLAAHLWAGSWLKPEAIAPG